MHKLHNWLPVFALLCCASLAMAQATSSVTGTVFDPTGAVIPGAQIEIVNTANQSKRTTTSNSDGRYSFPQVTPGTYVLRASSSGFRNVLIGDVQLLVNQPATLDITFTEVGANTETVSVSAEAIQVNTTDASLGNALSNRPIVELPLEARNVAGLLTLQAGVTYIGNREDLATDKRNGAVAGGRSDQANVTLDGVDVNDQQNGFAFDSVLRNTLDSVQEFRVTTVNPTADLGRSSGAQISLVTKSGTNEYHGSLYEYHRNTVTTSNEYFNNAIPATESNPEGGAPRPKLIRNIFGVSFGGPIIKNRLFYFANYEGRRDAREDSVVRTVPSESLRQGIVQYQNTDGGVSSLSPTDIQQMIDPLGIGPSQAMLQAFNAYPMPNSDEVGDNLNTRGFRFSAPIRGKYDTYIAKLDAYLDSASKYSVFIRGNLQNDHANTAPQFPGQPPARVNLNNSKGIAIGFNAVFSPSLIGATRYGFTRQGIENTGALSTPFLGFRSISSPFSTTRGLAKAVPVHQISQDMTWMKGSHNVRFGAVARVIRNQREDYQNSYFNGSFNDSWLYKTGVELRQPLTNLASSFNTAYTQIMTPMLGLVTQVNANYNYDLQSNPLAQGTPQHRVYAEEEYEFYVQDTWNVTRGLTVTGGVRWSLSPPVYEQQGYQTTVLPNLYDWLVSRGNLANQGQSQADAGIVQFVRSDSAQGRPLYPYHKKNFSPRLAVAFSPQANDGWQKKLFGGPGKTTIRAGASILYDVYGQAIMNNFNAVQLGFTSALTNPSGVLHVADAPRFTSFFDIPAGITPSAPESGFPQIPPRDAFAITQGIDDNLKPPYTLNFNLSIGRELPHGFFVEASYVSRLGRRLLSSEDMAMPTNLVDPQSGQTYFAASSKLAMMSQAGTPISDVAPIAFWENMFPDGAGDVGYGEGNTATQNVYGLYDEVGPDYLTGLQVLDLFCFPACSTLGPYTMFNDQYSALASFRSVANSAYHSMQFSVRKRFSSGYQFDMNYTLSRATDWASSLTREGEYDLTGFIINAWNPKQNISVSDWDIRHQFNFNGVVELPFGQGKAIASGAGKALNAVIGGWQMGGVWYWTSALPTYVYNGRAWATEWNLSGYGVPTGPLKTQMGIFKNAPAIAGAGGPNIFADPQAAFDSYRYITPGETGIRNTLRGDGFFTIDMNLNKRFIMPYNENHSLQFRWEVFNITNTARFDVNSIGNEGNNFLTIASSFGKYTGVLTRPRVMQFGLRYEF